MRILRQTLDAILRTIGTHPVESGGIIGSKGQCICAFAFDNAYTSQYEYRPNVYFLNSVIRHWNKNGIRFCGFVHSHLYGFGCPSDSDKAYAKQLKVIGKNIDDLYFPIIVLDDYSQPIIRAFRYDSNQDMFVEESIISEEAEQIDA